MPDEIYIEKLERMLVIINILGKAQQSSFIDKM